MPFVPLEKYPEFSVLQSNVAVIAEELRQVKKARWGRWGSDATGADGNAMFLNEGGDWTIFPVYAGSEKFVTRHPHVMAMSPVMRERLVDKMVATFPKTTALLRPIKRVNFAAFSRLGGHSELAPHTHQNPGALVLHLGVEVPSNGTAGLQVGDDTHIWEPGSMVIFNDGYVHSAWHRGDGDRIIFYIDFACDDPDGERMSMS